MEAKAVPVRISGGLSHVGLIPSDLLVLHPSLLVFFLDFSCEALIRTLLFLGLQYKTGEGRPVMFFFLEKPVKTY